MVFPEGPELPHQLAAGVAANHASFCRAQRNSVGALKLTHARSEEHLQRSYGEHGPDGQERSCSPHSTNRQDPRNPSATRRGEIRPFVLRSESYNSCMPLSASIENHPKGIAVVSLSGRLTLGSSLKIADSQIQAAIEDGVSRVVLDLTDVEYMDSAGLGMLMVAFGLVNEKNGSLRLCGVAPRVMSLLQMTRTDGLLPIDPTREESLAALRGESNSPVHN